MPKKASFEEEKISENIKKTFAHQLKKIYKKGDSTKIGIDTSTMSKYLNGHNFPIDYNLVKIKEYYNVPYSFLFGEIESTDINNQYIELNFGLNNFTATKLRNLRKNLFRDSFDNNYSSEIRLYVINEIIQNDKFTEKLGDITYIDIYAKMKNINLLKQSKERFAVENAFFNSKFYESIVSKAIDEFIKHIENLDIRNVPPKIIEHSEEYIYKYKSAFHNNIEQPKSLQNKTTENQ